jgi:transcriptional regulator with XRE-family HTH domain
VTQPRSAEMDLARRNELANFVRNRRGELQPDDVGLPRVGRRRVSGLRRHEVADLAGVSVTWYTWLEQARDIRMSAQALDAVSRALNLTEDEWKYVRRLAAVPIDERRTLSAELVPYAQGLVDDLAPHPACLATIACDLVAWNRGYSAIMGDPNILPPDRRNWLWSFFTSVPIQKRIRDWNSFIPNVVARFRSEASKYPGNARFSELISSLEEVSEEFRATWSEHHVQQFVPRLLTVDDEYVGEIQMNQLELRDISSPGLSLIVFRLADEMSKDRLLRLLTDEKDRVLLKGLTSQ